MEEKKNSPPQYKCHIQPCESRENFNLCFILATRALSLDLVYSRPGVEEALSVNGEWVTGFGGVFFFSLDFCFLMVPG